MEKGTYAEYFLLSPARRLLGFWLRSLKAATMEEEKGQTRSWLIKAPLPAGRGNGMVELPDIIFRTVRR